jgi:hypothetical protein
VHDLALSAFKEVLRWNSAANDAKMGSYTQRERVITQLAQQMGIEHDEKLALLDKIERGDAGPEPVHSPRGPKHAALPTPGRGRGAEQGGPAAAAGSKRGRGGSRRGDKPRRQQVRTLSCPTNHVLSTLPLASTIIATTRDPNMRIWLADP